MIQPGNGSERRKHPRIKAEGIPINIVLDGGECAARTVNISRAGAYCLVDQYIEPMTKLKVVLNVPLSSDEKNTKTKKIKCQGVVVRIEKTDGGNIHNVAIFFNDISQQDAECIAEFVSTHLETEEC